MASDCVPDTPTGIPERHWIGGFTRSQQTGFGSVVGLGMGGAFDQTGARPGAGAGDGEAVPDLRDACLEGGAHFDRGGEFANFGDVRLSGQTSGGQVAAGGIGATQARGV